MAYVNVKDWSVDQVTDWLKGLDSVILQYNSSFLNNGVTGHQLLSLRADDLEHLGVKLLGHQEIILEAVEHLRNFFFSVPFWNYTAYVHCLQIVHLKKMPMSRIILRWFQKGSEENQNKAVRSLLVISDVYWNTQEKYWICRFVYENSRGQVFLLKHFQLDKENLQTLALKLSCAANSLFNELASVDDDSSVLQTQVMSDVHNIITTIKPLVYWLDRSPFAGDKDYIDNKTNLLQLGFEMATSAHRGIFSEKPVCTVRKICEKLSKIADHIIQEITDPMILQPACLDLATLKKKEQELGFFILPNNHAIHQIADIKHGSPAHSSSKIEEGDEIVQVNYQTVVGWQRKKTMMLLQESPPEIVLTLKKRPRHTKVYGQIYMKPYRLPSRKRSGQNWSARWNDNVPSPRLLPIIDLPCITVSKIDESVENHDAETELSSSDSEPPDSPTDVNGRVYPLKPRPILQRRNTITGATPTNKRPYPSIEQYWDFIKPRPSTTHASSSGIDGGGSAFEADSRFLRDKSASCNVGLDLGPRPTTVIGLSRRPSRRNVTRVDFQEAADPPPPPHPDLGGEKSVSVTSLVSVGSEAIGFIDEGRELTDRTSMALDWKKEIVEEIIDTLKMKAVVEERTENAPEQAPTPLPPKDPILRDINVHDIIRQFDGRPAAAARPRVLPRAPPRRPPEVPQKARPAVPPRSAATRLRGRLDKSHSTPAYDLTGGEEVEAATAEGAGEAEGLLGKASEPEVTVAEAINLPLIHKEDDGTLEPPAEPRRAEVPPKPPPRNFVDIASKPAYPVDSPKPSPFVDTPQEPPGAKPAFVFPDVAQPADAVSDHRDAPPDADTPLGSDREPARPFEPKTASTPVAKSRTDAEKSAPSYEIQRAGGEAKVSPTNSIVKAMMSSKGKLKKKNTLTAKRRKVAVSDLSPGDIQGYLYQRLRGKHNQNVHWEKRWFVLLGNCLYGFKTKDCSKASSLIFLSGLTVAVASEVKSRSNAFKVYHTGTVFYFSADDSDAFQSWIDLIRAATLQHHEPPKSRDSKLYSETDDSDEDGDKAKRPPADKSDSLKKFGSLKKFTSSKKPANENTPASGSTSLDRKWFFKSSNQTKHSLPVPTDQFRSYRKIRTAEMQVSVTTGNFTSHVPFFTPQSQNVSVPNLTAEPIKYGHVDDSSKTKQKPANYVHASNPSLCNSSDYGSSSSFTPKGAAHPHLAQPRPSQPDNLAGFVTLEELMNRQTEERKMNPHHVVEEVERNMMLARPDVVYGEVPIRPKACETPTASSKSRGCAPAEKSDAAGSSCFGKRLGSLKKSQPERDGFESKTATYPKASRGHGNRPNGSLPRAHKIFVHDEADSPYTSTKSLKERPYEMIFCPERVAEVQFATNRTLDGKMYADAPKRGAKVKKQHSFSSGDKKSKFTGKVHDAGSSMVKLKSVTQYTPMLLPTSQDPKSKPRFAFELNLDEKTQKGGKLKQMFGGKSDGKKEKTFLGSPKLHRAIFQKHGSGSDLSWPSSSSFSQQISMTQSTFSLENSPPALPESFAMNISPHADYPGLEYPPVFEPETYSLADPESSLSILRKQSKNTTP